MSATESLDVLDSQTLTEISDKNQSQEPKATGIAITGGLFDQGDEWQWTL